MSARALLLAALVAVPAAACAWPAGRVPSAPANFRVTVFADRLEAPLALLVLPDGAVAVAEARGGRGETRPSPDRVSLLSDTNGDGVADARTALEETLVRPSALALRRDRLYVATEGTLVACPYLVGQARFRGECRPLAELPGTREAFRHALAFDGEEATLYVGTEAGEGTLARLKPDGHDAGALAAPRGRPAALALEPASLAPWGAFVRDGRALLAPLGGGAEVALGDGERPTALLFYARAHFPKAYRGGAFVALGGGDGHAARVVFVPFADGRPAGPAEPFVGGFEGEDGTRLGRPAALAAAPDGTLLVADELGGTIWRVTFKCAACTPDPVPPPRARRAH